MTKFEMQYQGKRYVYNGRSWTDSSGMKPPQTVINALDIERDRKARAEDVGNFNADDLLRRAIIERDNGRLVRAQELAERACQVAPMSIGPVITLSSILRDRGEPERALELTAPFESHGNHVLLTTRAAALFDLRRWDEGKRVLDRAYAIAKSLRQPTHEIANCYARHKSESPSTITAYSVSGYDDVEDDEPTPTPTTGRHRRK
jgi:hypothetical protein